VHRGSKAAHQVVPISERTSDSSFCELHPGFLRTMFCEQDRALICDRCSLLDSHKGHQLLQATEAARSQKDSFASDLNDVVDCGERSTAWLIAAESSMNHTHAARMDSLFAQEQSLVAAVHQRCNTHRERLQSEFAGFGRTLTSLKQKAVAVQQQAHNAQAHLVQLDCVDPALQQQQLVQAFCSTEPFESQTISAAAKLKAGVPYHAVLPSSFGNAFLRETDPAMTQALSILQDRVPNSRSLELQCFEASRAALPDWTDEEFDSSLLRLGSLLLTDSKMYTKHLGGWISVEPFTQPHRQRLVQSLDAALLNRALITVKKGLSGCVVHQLRLQGALWLLLLAFFCDSPLALDAFAPFPEGDGLVSYEPQDRGFQAVLVLLEDVTCPDSIVILLYAVMVAAGLHEAGGEYRNRVTGHRALMDPLALVSQRYFHLPAIRCLFVTFVQQCMTDADSPMRVRIMLNPDMLPLLTHSLASDTDSWVTLMRAAHALYRIWKWKPSLVEIYRPRELVLSLYTRRPTDEPLVSDLSTLLCGWPPAESDTVPPVGQVLLSMESALLHAKSPAPHTQSLAMLFIQAICRNVHTASWFKTRGVVTHARCLLLSNSENITHHRRACLALHGMWFYNNQLHAEPGDLMALKDVADTLAWPAFLQDGRCCSDALSVVFCVARDEGLRGMLQSLLPAEVTAIRAAVSRHRAVLEADSWWASNHGIEMLLQALPSEDPVAASAGSE